MENFQTSNVQIKCQGPLQLLSLSLDDSSTDCSTDAEFLLFCQSEKHQNSHDPRTVRYRLKFHICGPGAP